MGHSFARPALRLPLLFAAVGLLGACHLIDQESFGGDPRPPAPDLLTAALASGSGLPLITIHPQDQVPYATTLANAVASARALHGTTHFRVEVALPATAVKAGQAPMTAATTLVEPVLDAMAQDGVAPERITLDASVQQNIAQVAVSVYADQSVSARATRP